MRKEPNPKLDQPRRATLSNADALLWQAWQLATEAVASRIGRDLAEETGLSGADYGVLTRLAQGGGSLRQQDLADAMGWHKSRLSHHLSRMEPRALVRRKPMKANSVLVAITATGKRALQAALPVRARAVQSHFAAKVPRAERRRCLALLARLANG